MFKHIRIALHKIDYYRYDLLVGLTIFILSLLLTTLSWGQGVGINNITPHTKALLDLNATDRGFLVPRMTQAQRFAMFAVADPTAKGMLVYQTDAWFGFYYYDGIAWQFLSTNNSGWNVLGNAGTNPVANFIGTTDLQDVVMR